MDTIFLIMLNVAQIIEILQRLTPLLQSIVFTKTMKRYFYRANPTLRNWLEKTYLVTLQQQHVFRSAMLALVHNCPDKHSLPDLYQQLLDLTIKQHYAVSQANHIEQAFTMFNSLYKIATHYQIRPVMIATQFSSHSTAIMDPDKFAIYDLKDPGFRKWRTGWTLVEEQLMKRIGFRLVVKSSSLQHMQAGRGVFVQMHDEHVKNEAVIRMGSLLGFAPGLLFKDNKTYKNYLKTKSQIYSKQYCLNLTNQNVLEMSKIVIPPSEDVLPAEYLNPYAVGQYLNHPPPSTPANVCLQVMTLPKLFLPDSHLEFLPYSNIPGQPYEDRDQDLLRVGVGIFAMRDIRHGEELFVDYFEQHALDTKSKNSGPAGKQAQPEQQELVIPEWLLEPPPCSPFLEKNEYEHVPSMFWTVLEELAMRQNKQKYQKFKAQVKYEPSRVLYENDFKKYQQLVKTKYEIK